MPKYHCDYCREDILPEHVLVAPATGKETCPVCGRYLSDQWGK